MSTDENAYTLADQYVTLAAEIKERSASLTTMRKNLKKLDAALLDTMRRSDIMEVIVRGVTIQCTTKLHVKT